MTGNCFNNAFIQLCVSYSLATINGKAIFFQSLEGMFSRYTTHIAVLFHRRKSSLHLVITFSFGEEVLNIYRDMYKKTRCFSIHH